MGIALLELRYLESAFVIPMTHVPEIYSIFRRRFLVRVSCISGTGFVWYQIPVASRILFYSKPESDMHVTENDDL